MATRPSLAEGLSPEQQEAFLRAKKRPVAATKSQQDVLASSSEKVSYLASELANSRKEEALYQLNVRVPKSILNRLRMAITKQKIEGRQPDTQQDIVLDAVHEWLDRYEKTNGR
jgi:hypothetical protein